MEVEIMLKYVETKEAPAAIGPYSQGVVVNGFAFFSGQVPLSPQTGEVVGTTIEEQSATCSRNSLPTSVSPTSILSITRFTTMISE